MSFKKIIKTKKYYTPTMYFGGNIDSFDSSMIKGSNAYSDYCLDSRVSYNIFIL